MPDIVQMKNWVQEKYIIYLAVCIYFIVVLFTSKRFEQCITDIKYPLYYF